MLKTSLIAGPSQTEDCVKASEPCAKSKDFLVQSPAEFETSWAGQRKQRQMPTPSPVEKIDP